MLMGHWSGSLESRGQPGAGLAGAQGLWKMWAVPAVPELPKPQEMLCSRAEVTWLERGFKDNFGITAWRAVIS